MNPTVVIESCTHLYPICCDHCTITIDMVLCHTMVMLALKKSSQNCLQFDWIWNWIRQVLTIQIGNPDKKNALNVHSILGLVQTVSPNPVYGISRLADWFLKVCSYIVTTATHADRLVMSDTNPIWPLANNSADSRLKISDLRNKVFSLNIA